MSKGCISCQSLRQDFPGSFEFIPDKSQPEKPSPHGVFWIFILLWLRAGCFYHFCHLAQCKAKLNITLKLSCVKPAPALSCGLIELEKPEFDRPFCKCCMVVQHMVTAVIVVVAPAAVCIVATVPNIGKLCHRSWLSAVDLFQKPWINRPAVASHPALIKIQSICDQAFVAGHDVCQVAERLRRMAFGSDMDVNTASSGGIALCSCVAQLPDQFL